MPSTLTNLLYHITFSTKKRVNTILEFKEDLYKNMPPPAFSWVHTTYCVQVVRYRKQGALGGYGYISNPPQWKNIAVI